MNDFPYSEEFVERIRDLHRGKEGWRHYGNYLQAHLRGRGSRLVLWRTELVPEMGYRCGRLSGMRILDLGCGTGSTTAALAEAADEVIGFDVQEEGVEIARARLAEHGLGRRASVVHAARLEDVVPRLGLFNLVLMNGVLEHVPLTVAGLRRGLVRSAFAMLRPGGFLYLNDTPNRLWPVDGHSTGLPFLSYLPAGSELAYRIAVMLDRHAEADTHSRGPHGLEEVGAWGATYWEVRRYLDGLPARCLNLEPGQDAHVTYTRPASRRRRLLEGTLYVPAVKVLKVPITAFTHSLSHLVFRREPA